MTYSGTLSSKGQITIPIEVRKRLGLHEGDKLEFVVEGNTTTIRPAKRTDNPFARYRGLLADELPGTIEEIVRQERISRGRDIPDHERGR
ncbi:MAG: antitoxin PrlF [Bryobacterales bacterium]|nr:antitoxin PrlF [Bryobacterales bacterium]